MGTNRLRFTEETLLPSSYKLLVLLLVLLAGRKEERMGRGGGKGSGRSTEMSTG